MGRVKGQSSRSRKGHHQVQASPSVIVKLNWFPFFRFLCFGTNAFRALIESQPFLSIFFRYSCSKYYETLEDSVSGIFKAEIVASCQWNTEWNLTDLSQFQCGSKSNYLDSWSWQFLSQSTYLKSSSKPLSTSRRVQRISWIWRFLQDFRHTGEAYPIRRHLHLSLQRPQLKTECELRQNWSHRYLQRRWDIHIRLW